MGYDKDMTQSQTTCEPITEKRGKDTDHYQSRNYKNTISKALDLASSWLQS